MSDVPFSEDRLLRSIAAASRELGEAVEIGPGDDMALVRIGSAHVLLACDQVVVGRHVAFDAPPEAIARKAIARNLSDCAAMAARPVALLASATLPANVTHARADALALAIRSQAASFGVPLVGGDVATAPAGVETLVVSVSVIAEPWDDHGRVVRRSAARPGDHVFVSGALGGAWRPDGGGPHLSFTPRVELARALLEHLGDDLHAMIDLSDGLGRDADRIARASGVHVEVHAARLPCREGTNWRDALGHGEDYELCWTATPGSTPPVLSGVAIHEVGVVVAADDGDPRARARTPKGTWIDIGASGWDHRASAPETNP